MAEQASFGANPLVDPATATRDVFELLAEFVAGIAGTSRGGDAQARLLDCVGHWLTTPRSRLFDPAIQTMFQRLLSRGIHDLSHFLRTAGLNVLYVDESRLLLACQNADASVVVRELRQQVRLCRWIEFEVVEEYAAMSFLDLYNLQTAQHPGSWNVARFMDAEHGKALEETIAVLLDEGPRAAVERCANQLFHLADRAAQRPVKHPNDLRDSRCQVDSQFLTLISVLWHVTGNLEDPQWRHLRGSLLRQAKIGEFDARTTYSDPSLSLSVGGVSCHRCAASRGIDILRSEPVLSHNWFCAHCRQPYDVSEFEEVLYNVLCQRTLGLSRQDLVCQKCQRAASSGLAMSCSDGGTLQLTHKVADHVAWLRTLAIACKYHDFKELGEVVEVQLSYLGTKG